MLALATTRRCLGILLLVAAGQVAAAEQVTVERDSALYAEPRADAAEVARLRQGMTGDVVEKKGVWLNLRTLEGTGWIFSFNVRFPTRPAAQSDGGGSVLGRLFAPRRASVATTSTIGIRGLDEEDLRQATFSAAQIQLLDQYAASREAAESQASASGLTPVQVQFLGDAP